MSDIPFISWITNLASDDYEISGEDDYPSKNDSDLEEKTLIFVRNIC